MKTGDRFQYIVVASNAATGDRVSAGAVSNATLQDLIRDLRAAGLTSFQIIETLRTKATPVLGWKPKFPGPP